VLSDSLSILQKLIFHWAVGSPYLDRDKFRDTSVTSSTLVKI
jgi:hypothetical protein